MPKYAKDRKQKLVTDLFYSCGCVPYMAIVTASIDGRTRFLPYTTYMETTPAEVYYDFTCSLYSLNTATGMCVVRTTNPLELQHNYNTYIPQYMNN